MGLVSVRHYQQIPVSLRPRGTNTAGDTVTVVLSTASTSSVSVAGDVRQTRLDQAWFWTPTWQAMEREADEDLVAGRYDDFDTLDDFIDDLERLMEE